MAGFGAANNRLEWATNTLGVTYVDPNSWVHDWDFIRYGLHINRREGRQLSQMYSRVCCIGGGRQRMTMHGGTELQQRDIRGDGDDINIGTHDVGLENF